MSTPFNYPPHLPDFDDMDPDGAIEILRGEDDNGYQHLDFESVCYYRNQGSTSPWRHTQDWIPRRPPEQPYVESDFAWALSRILKKIVHTRDLKRLGLGLSDEDCGRILFMRNQAEAKSRDPSSVNRTV